MRVAPVAFLAILCLPAVRAQESGGKMAFEVASIKLSKGEPVDLPFWDEYSPTNGRFHADATLSEFIEFAYNTWSNKAQRRELSRLPKWASDDRYRIEARAPMGNPTKDQMFLMVQSLLAERFQLAARFEDRELPVFEVKLARPGARICRPMRTGLHATGLVSLRVLVSPALYAIHFFHSTFPEPRFLARAMSPWAVVTRTFSWLRLGLGRPIIDKTGLRGNV